ncbi:hypothetical protein TUM4644_33970 [Shewanella colwelliana]|uniref:KfrA N-terminal DNA-binding domain-containing protein n=1 Tax=Shewanella colwelliana TaxID=23 RepID=A0A1E5IXG6_SHECO|nr:hypothetical protein [Shewanella colwelliana]MDX1281690.1 hypothetical protein [Shewanella colwelliana]OEG75127.1 hypothetical protein BEL05_02390 [Shewanella colwelliana]GIU33321.1 hypothetical protein TUM4644_33970 [Shewanella colwelliana]GIU37539.1 hypothetical protein TUM3794_08430 [Shewanella colwelliana]
MSPIEQVLAAAKSIASSGKTPSLALIKSRLGKQLPMPILVQGLQRFKALSKEEVAALVFDSTNVANQETEQPTPHSIATLVTQVTALQLQQQQLIARIEMLETALNNRDNH